MKKFSREYLVFGALVLLNISVQSQVSEKLKEIEKAYPNENIVCLQQSKKYRIEMKGNKPKVTLEVYTEDILLNDYMATYETDDVSYSKLRKIKNLEAWTMTPVNDKYKKVEVEKFETKKDLSNRIFHDDIEDKVFKYPQLKKGAIKCLKVEYEFELAEMFDMAQLMMGKIIRNYDIEIEVDNEIKLTALPFNFNSIQYTKDEKINKNTTVYTWNFKNLAKAKSESGGTEYLYFAPHLRFRIDYFIDKKNDTISVLKDVASLFKFNHQFVAGLSDCKNKNLQSLVDSLTRNEANPLLKAKSIYYWVKANIKYIAFESGFQGYIPRDADDIYIKKYGDCKDMANIIHKMYTYAKLDSVYLTWIGSDDLPYRIDEIRMPGAFNHMITTWIYQGNTYYLDATNQFISWGFPSSFIQGKEALICIDSAHFEVKTVPIVDYAENKTTKTVELEIKGDTLVGNGQCTMTAYSKHQYIYKTEGLTKAEKFQVIKNQLELGNNKFMLQDFKEINRDDIDSPLIIKFDFILPGYISILNKDEIYLNLFLERYGSMSDLNDQRISGFKADFKSQSDINISLKIPEGYTVKYTPKNESIEMNNFSFQSTFLKSDSKLNLTYQFIHDFLILPKQEYKQLKEYQNKILDILSETISIKKLN